MTRLAACTGSVVLALSTCIAGTIQLQDGTTLDGTIISRAGQVVAIRTASGVHMVQAGEIASAPEASAPRGEPPLAAEEPPDIAKEPPSSVQGKTASSKFAPAPADPAPDPNAPPSDKPLRLSFAELAQGAVTGLIPQALAASLFQAAILMIAAHLAAKAVVGYWHAYKLSLLLAVLGRLGSLVLLAAVGPFGLTLARIVMIAAASALLLLSFAALIYGKSITDDGGRPIGLKRGFFTAMAQALILAAIVGVGAGTLLFFHSRMA